MRLTREQTAKNLQSGQVVAIPTETVYGLAASIYDEKAIDEIYRLKNRPRNNPLIIHIADYQQLATLTTFVPEEAMKLAQTFWPGPLTLVLPKSQVVSDKLTAGSDTAGFRMPAHPLTRLLLQETKLPLAAPSANPSGYLSPTNAEDVELAFAPFDIPVLDGGACKRGIESTVVGFPDGKTTIYRHGAITQAALETCLQRPLQSLTESDNQPLSPGMLSKHYSPKSKLVITDDINQALGQVQHERIGVLSFQQEYDHPAIQYQVVLSPSGNLQEAAHHFFAGLYRLDQLNLDYILATWFPNKDIGIALNDRLRRGAVPS